MFLINLKHITKDFPPFKLGFHGKKITKANPNSLEVFLVTLTPRVTACWAW